MLKAFFYPVMITDFHYDIQKTYFLLFPHPTAVFLKTFEIHCQIYYSVVISTF